MGSSFERYARGELSDDSLETRDILRNFAVFSPRADSPTATMTVGQISDVLRQHEFRQHLEDMDVDGGGENQPMDLDHGLNGIENHSRENDAEEPGEEPPTNEEAILEDINERRRRALEEIEDHLSEATSQEEIWYWEAQRDFWYSVP